MNTATHCLHCHVPRVPGSGFCGTCGAPAERGAAVQMPPAMPLPPAFTGGVSAIVPLSVSAAETGTQAAATALGSAGASVTGMAENMVAFTATRSSKRTLGFKARFRGIATIIPGGATLRVKLVPGSIAPVAILLTIVFYAGLAFSSTQQGFAGQAGDPRDQAGLAIGLLFGPIVLGTLIPWFAISRGSARAVLNSLVRAVGKPRAAVFVTPASPAAPPPSPPPPAANQGVFDQLRELGTLREQEILSAAEFDQARAALLAKIV